MEPPPHIRTRRTVASAVSYVLNPLVLPPILLMAILAHVQAPASELASVGATAFVLFTLLPLGFLIGYRRRGGASTLEVRDRARRKAPYVFALGCGAAALFALYAQIATARPLLLAIVVLLNVNMALLFLINRWMKISIHAAAAAGFVAVLLVIAVMLPLDPGFLEPTTLMWLLPLVPSVMWARVRSGAHSTAEVFAGAAFGAVVPAIELLALIRFGVAA